MPKEGNFYVYEKRKDGSFRDLKKSLFVGQCIRGYFDEKEICARSIIKSNTLDVRWDYYVFSLCVYALEEYLAVRMYKTCVRICSGVVLEG